MIKNGGALSDDTFFSYSTSSSGGFFNFSTSFTEPASETFSHYLDTQTFVTGVSSKLQSYDSNLFYFMGIINVDRTMMNQQGETLEIVLSRKRFDESVSLLDVLPFIKKSTFGVSRNSGPIAPLSYKMHFGQGNEARDNMTFNSGGGGASTASAAAAGGNGYDERGNLMTMMNLRKFNSSIKITWDHETAYYSSKLETVFIFSLGARAFNLTNVYLYNNDFNIRLDGSVIESIPRTSNNEHLVLSFYVKDYSYTSLFSAVEQATKGQIYPFPTLVSGLSYQFLKFNTSDFSSMPCPNFPRRVLFASFLNTTLSIDWILFGLVLLLCPLFLLYRNEQPLKSRLFIPYLGIIFLLILFIGVQYSIDSSRSAEIKNIVSVSFFIMALFSFIFQAFRYYYLRYLYSKVDITVKQSRLKKFLSSKTVFVMALVFAIILGLIYMIVVLSVALTSLSGGGNTAVNKQDVEVEFYTRIAIPAFAAFVLFACLFIDILINFKSFFRNIGRFFFFEDPLFFRSELLLVIPTCLFYIVEFVLNSETRPYLDGSLTTNLLPKNIHEIRTMIGFFGIFRFLNLFCFVLFFGEALVLAVTISRVIRRNYRHGKVGLALFQPANSPLGLLRSKSSSDEDVIEKFVSQDDGHRLLEEFSRNEFSIENIMLYDILQKFPLIEKNEESQKKVLMDIYLKFIMANSEYEINLSSSTRKAYELIIEDLQDDKPLQTAEIIQTLKIEVIQNMADTFGRLSMSPEYDTLLAKWETEKATALKV